MATDNGTVEMVAGDYRKLQFTLTDADNGGAALNLTTLDVTFAMAADVRGAPDVTKTEGDGITITDAAGGLCEVELLTADTSSLAPGRYYWELEVTDASSQSTVVATGAFKVAQNIANS